jgi:hypothetical protein
MAAVLAQQSAQLRSQGDALIRRVDDLSCQSWNERMWSAGELIEPSPTIN